MPSKPKAAAQSSSYRSQKATVDDLSLFEKLDTIPAFLSILANTFAAVFTGVFRPNSRPKSYYNYVNLTSIRTMCRRTSTRQQQYLIAPTDDSYEVACKKRGVTPNSEVLEDGTRAHWIGNSKAEKIIVNFHGGGYVVPASPEMVEFMFQIVDVLTKQGKSAAVLFLSYDLAPGAVYPRQLQQAAALFNHVLHKLNYSPSNIILTGDSAGANLATSLLSHIAHPHPSGTVPKVEFEGKLAGVVLISPWVDFSLDEESFAKNKYKDCIDPAALTKWSAAFLGSSKLDYYNQASTAPESWWADLPAEKVLVLAGEEEVLVDGIVKFEEKLKKGFGEGKVEFLVAKGEYHDEPSIALQFGYKESDEGEQARLIKRWIGSKL